MGGERFARGCLLTIDPHTRHGLDDSLIGTVVVHRTATQLATAQGDQHCWHSTAA